MNKMLYLLRFVCLGELFHRENHENRPVFWSSGTDSAML
jgi:hypothetical protein